MGNMGGIWKRYATKYGIYGKYRKYVNYGVSGHPIPSKIWLPIIHSSF